MNLLTTPTLPKHRRVRDLDENTQLDIDKDGTTMIIEHAGDRADIPNFHLEQIAAQ